MGQAVDACDFREVVGREVGEGCVGAVGSFEKKQKQDRDCEDVVLCGGCAVSPYLFAQAPREAAHRAWVAEESH